MIIVKMKGRNDTLKDVIVRRQKVHDALLWFAQNNPHCADVEINEQALNSLPDNGAPTDLLTVETGDHILLEGNIDLDLGPLIDNHSEDTVYKKSTDISSF